MVQYQEPVGVDSQAGIGVPIVVAEFDLEDVGCQRFDDRTDLPTAQAGLWQVYGERYDV